MTARALGVKWVGRGERGEFEISDLKLEMPPATASCESSDASATAPNPFVQRSSISRRLRGRGMKRLQCILVHKDEFFYVDQHVTEVSPCFDRVGILFLLLGKELQRRFHLVRLRRAPESGDVEIID